MDAQVTLYVAPESRAGTEDVVFVNFKGEFGTTGPISVFPYGVLRNTKHSATIRAKDVGGIESLTVTQGGHDGVRVQGAMVAVGGVRYSIHNGAGTSAFEWADNGGDAAATSYPVFVYDECEKAYAVKCEPSPLTANALVTASSDRGQWHALSGSYGQHRRPVARSKWLL